MFRERGGYALSFYFLKKAEKKAKELDQFNILEVIYEEYTQLAVKDIEIDIEEVLERRKANLEKVKIQRRNTEAIAIITQQLKKSNFSREKSSVIDLLEKTLKNVEASAEIFHSSEGKIQVFRVVGTLLLQKEAYGQLVQYVRLTISEFESGNLFNANNHSDRLLMRLWLVNALSKTAQFQEAEAELLVFAKEIVMHHKQNYFAYLFYYITCSSVNVFKCLRQYEMKQVRADCPKV
jgi:translation elongation factor EF-1beta